VDWLVPLSEKQLIAKNLLFLDSSTRQFTAALLAVRVSRIAL